mgnify:CR=1 FL=1
MRLIDADVLRKELRNKSLPLTSVSVNFVRKLIDNAPTIEPHIEYIYQKKQRPQGK